MPRYAVLVRGINVGKAKRLAMAEFRALLDDLGYTAVRTHLNSGNAVVTGPEADPAAQAARIEQKLADTVGLDARCMLLSADELRAIIDGHPFAAVVEAVEKGGSRMMANVLSADPDPALLAEHDVVALDPDRIRIGPRVIYQWCPDGILEAPPVGGFAEKRLGVTVTARNWNTVTKLAELL